MNPIYNIPERKCAMSYISEKEAILKTKIIPQTKKPDFEEFWAKSVAQLRAAPLEVRREKLKTPYDKTFTTYEVFYNTHDRTVVSAYFSVPNGATGKLPCVVEFHGGSMKGKIYPNIVATGVCCFSMHVRAQGGTVVDGAEYQTTDFNGGLMTRGLLNKDDFYMKNIYLDAIRAMDVAAQLEEVDPDRIVTYGGSQGGALSITASALSGRSCKCYTYVTSYCCIHRRVELGSRIYKSTHDFLKSYPQYTDLVLDNMTYFDVNNMVSLLKVPTSFCLALADDVCLPEFVYSAYAHAECEKDIMFVPFAPHCLPEPYKDFAEFEFAQL